MTDGPSFRLPSRLTLVRHADITRDSKREVADSIAPGLEHLVTAAGTRLSQEQIEQLRVAFGERGVIEVPVGGETMSATLSVAGSLNYSSKELQSLQNPREG
jgi:hypothetical protein